MTYSGAWYRYRYSDTKVPCTRCVGSRPKGTVVLFHDEDVPNIEGCQQGQSTAPSAYSEVSQKVAYHIVCSTHDSKVLPRAAASIQRTAFRDVLDERMALGYAQQGRN
jgi:hypothetical protein